MQTPPEFESKEMDSPLEPTEEEFKEEHDDVRRSDASLNRPDVHSDSEELNVIDVSDITVVVDQRFASPSFKLDEPK